MSTDTIVLLHNPRCSKSRQLKALLDERGTSYVERCYLDQPLSRSELTQLGRSLGRPIVELVRTSEAAFQEAGLAGVADEEALLDALSAHPILLQRPILMNGDRAAIGRPPEAALGVLSAGDRP